MSVQKELAAAALRKKKEKETDKKSRGNEDKTEKKTKTEKTTEGPAGSKNGKGGKDEKKKKKPDGSKSEKAGKTEKKTEVPEGSKSEKEGKDEKKKKKKKAERPDGSKSEKGGKTEKKTEVPDGSKSEKEGKDENKKKKTEVPDGSKSEKGGSEKEGKEEKKTKVPDGSKSERGGKAEASKRKQSKDDKEGGRSNKKKKEKEPPIKFTEAKKPDIEHLFQTPDRKTRNGSPPPAEAKMTVKQRAEERLLELTKHLAPSDFDDDDSSCAATDLENLMLRRDQSPQENETPGSSGEEEEEDKEGSGAEDEKDEEQDDSEKEEDEDSDTSSSVSQEEQSGEGEDVDDDDDEEEEEDEENDDEDEEGAKEERKESKEEDKTPETETKPETEHALVPVTSHTQQQVASLKNSVTNKREWDTFCRQAKSRMPVSLNDMFQSNKQELFNIWLEAKQDWTACSLECERRHEQKNISTKGWKAEQGKTLKLKYTEEKWKTILASRKAAGLYYEDPDFPGDEDEPWLVLAILLLYHIHHSKLAIVAYLALIVANGESTALKASMDVNPEMRAALTDAETGLLRPGALPALTTATAAGNKALLDAIEKAMAMTIMYMKPRDQVTAAPKKRPKAKEEEKSENVEPQTWLQKATASLPVLLKDAADARTSSIKLQNMEYAKELSDQLLDHAKKLEGLYQGMSKAVTGNSDDKILKQLCKKCADMEAFGTKAQAHSGVSLRSVPGNYYQPT
eukprot:s2662_g4.t1